MKRLTNLPASVHARLLAHAKATHADFNRTLARYAVERFLHRLSRNEDYRDRFVLKGAMLFITWPETTYRPTSDLDLLAFGSPDPTTMRDVIAAICTTPVDDDPGRRPTSRFSFRRSPAQQPPDLPTRPRRSTSRRGPEVRRSVRTAPWKESSVRSLIVTTTQL